MMCAAAAVVSLAGVVRWMDLHRAGGEVLENRIVRVVVEDKAQLEVLSAPAETELAVAPPGAARALGSVPEGELEVLVRLGGEPLSGVEAELFDVTGERDASGRTDRDGIVRLSLRSERWHTLRVVAPDGSRAVREWKSGSERSVEVAFGSASLSGQAFDCEGHPWAHAALHALQSSGSEVIRRELRCDGEGRFACAGLLAGPVTVAEASAQPGASEVRSASTVIADGESARLDLGMPDATVEWHGFVRLRSGRVLDEAFDLLAVETSRGWVERLRSDELGRIAARLRSGDWSVQALAFDGSVEVGRLALRADSLEQDVTLPGACLRATLEPGETALVEERARPLVSLECGEAGALQLTLREGRLFLCGLPPGTWRVAAHCGSGEPEDWRELLVEEWEELLEVALPLSSTAADEP